MCVTTKLIILSFAVAALSTTLTRSKLFQWFPIKCTYCVFHWWAPLAVYHYMGADNIVIHSLAVISGASLVGYWIERYFSMLENK